MSRVLKVVKRNGNIVEFDKTRIVNAVEKASRRSGEEIRQNFYNKVFDRLKQTPGDLEVEHIQDIIELELIDNKYALTAKEYIQYRNWRNQVRAMQTETDKYIHDVINLSNLENENANMAEWVFTAKKEKIAGEIMKQYTDRYLLSPEIKKAFQDNIIYIHDYNSYLVGMHNCLLVDLGDILKNGFKTQNGDVRPPTSARSAMQLTAVVLQCVSNEQFGGVAVSSLDYDIAPYVRMSFYKWLKKGCEMNGLDYGIYSSSDLAKAKDSNDKILRWAYRQTDKEVFQSCEALIHNLNTLQSRSGNQLPFTSVNLGTDTSEEGRMISRNFMLARQSGVGKYHTTAIFPIGVFKHKKGINDRLGTPNYDLKKLAIETTSKRIYPNFANLDAGHLPKPTIKALEFATMGCRTALGIDRHGLEGYEGRGNASPVTINLPKIALLQNIHKGELFNEEKFWKDLDYAIDIAVQSLHERFEWQGKQLAKSAPFLYENQVLKHHRKLDPEENVREVLKHQTLAIGYIGLSNMLVALLGKHHGESQESLDFGLRVVQRIYDKAKEASEKYDLNFSCYATPAEGLCHKWAKANQKEFGVIQGVTDKDYINNSHHIPVYFNCSIKDKIDIESQFSKYATGGNITYVELDGNARNNLEALEEIINYAMDNNITYFAINHPIDECENCGYEGVIGDICPQCHEKDGDVSIKRLRRVTGYITSSYKEFFNQGKKSEVEDRVRHSQSNDLEELVGD